MIEGRPQAQRPSFSREISIIPGRRGAVFIESAEEPDFAIGLISSPRWEQDTERKRRPSNNRVAGNKTEKKTVLSTPRGTRLRSAALQTIESAAESEIGPTGPFPVGYVVRPGDFRDGLSNTVFVSEKLIGSGQTQLVDTQRDYWCLGIVIKPLPSANLLFAECQSLPSPLPTFCVDNGASWYVCGYDCTWYNHTVTPNGKSVVCKLDPCPRPEISNNSGGIFVWLRGVRYHDVG
jgi:hypothetical protein